MSGYQITDPRPPRLTGGHLDLVKAIRHRDRLNLWEQRFVASVADLDTVSARQLAMLKEICGKAIVRANPDRKTRRARRRKGAAR
jgi:hypothetical protein